MKNTNRAEISNWFLEYHGCLVANHDSSLFLSWPNLGIGIHKKQVLLVTGMIVVMNALPDQSV